MRFLVQEGVMKLGFEVRQPAFIDRSRVAFTSVSFPRYLPSLPPPPYLLPVNRSVALSPRCYPYTQRFALI